MEKSLFDLEYLLQEFESIPKKRVSAGTSTALDNHDRNRDPTVVPYEDCMVSLTPTNANRAGYINASFVQVMQTFLCKVFNNNI